MHLLRKTGELMEQIEALERRIAAALDRIGKALAQPDARAEEAAKREADLARAEARAEAALAEAARLSQALEEEQLVARQIKARNEALNAKLEKFEADIQDQMQALIDAADQARAAAAAAEAKSERLRGEILVRDALTSQLRRVNVQLRQNNLALRDAVLKGMPDPNLVNKAMLAELESIRASRDAERAEIDAVLEELRVILETGGLMGEESGAEPPPEAAHFPAKAESTGDSAAVTAAPGSEDPLLAAVSQDPMLAPASQDPMLAPASQDPTPPAEASLDQEMTTQAKDEASNA